MTLLPTFPRKKAFGESPTVITWSYFFRLYDFYVKTLIVGFALLSSLGVHMVDIKCHSICTVSVQYILCIPDKTNLWYYVTLHLLFFPVTSVSGEYSWLMLQLLHKHFQQYSVIDWIQIGAEESKVDKSYENLMIGLLVFFIYLFSF